MSSNDKGIQGHTLSLALRRAYLALHRETDNALVQIGMTANQFVLMAALAESDTVTQQELAHRTDSDANTVRAMLVLLERKGWIIRAANPSDLRARTVTLTSDGEKALEEAWRQSGPIRQSLSIELGPKNAAEIVRLLAIVRGVLSRSPSAGSDGE